MNVAKGNHKCKKIAYAITYAYNTPMNQEKQFKDLLRTNGERVSSPRIAIFHTLQRHSPITTPRLIGLLEGSSIDASTVYRNIELFRKLGVLNDIVTKGQRMIELGDLFQAHHHHFVCRECGSVQDFDNEKLEQMILSVSVGLGAEMKSHHIEISGMCNLCKNEKARS